MRQRLSRQQQDVLAHLYRLYVDQAPGPFGVPWRTTGTRSGQASLSRALRRLETRGLVLRQNQVVGSPDSVAVDPDGVSRPGYKRTSRDQRHGRTTHVELTAAGIEVAKGLTTGPSEYVNRPAPVDTLPAADLLAD